MSRRKFDFVRLEDRTAPAVFTVTTTADSNDNANPTAGSFRSALLSANATPGFDTISFNIAGTGVQTFLPAEALPQITEAVAIDGRTQPGYSGTPLIEISGLAQINATNGFILLNHTGSSIRGLNINGFDAAGIRIDGGGTHVVAGNWIGIDKLGVESVGNGIGVFITNASSGNSIAAGFSR